MTASKNIVEMTLIAKPIDYESTPAPDLGEGLEKLGLPPTPIEEQYRSRQCRAF
jgi:hypothetical protein